MISLIRYYKHPQYLLKQTLSSNKISNPIKAVTSTREYRSTPKQEIFPIILAATTIGTIGRYSYRALQRMEEDWDEYEAELKIYNKYKRQEDRKTLYKHGFLGVDIGSSAVRVSFRRGGEQTDKPMIVEDRTGLRYTPSYCYKPDYTVEGELLTGQLAKSKLYEKPKAVYNPRDTTNVKGLESLLRPIFTNALQKKIADGSSGSATTNSSNVLFGEGGYAVRPIITYPTSDLLPLYKSAMQNLAHISSDPLYLPESIAIYQSAVHYGIIESSPSSSSPLLIVDIGGNVLHTTLLDTSTKSTQKILHQSSLPIGANILQKAIVSLLIQNFFHYKSYRELSDVLALQRLHDAAESALLDLTTNSRTNISLPFLTVDKDMKPIHLDQAISLDVLTQEVNSIIQSTINNNNTNGNGDAFVSLPSNDTILSNNMPIPNDLSTLVSSFLMKQIFEENNLTPFQLHKVLIVGGAAKSPIYKNAVRNAFVSLSGDAIAQEKLVFAGSEYVEDLCALGAVISGSSGTDFQE